MVERRDIGFCGQKIENIFKERKISDFTGDIKEKSLQVLQLSCTAHINE
jgi:hypothetical protein